VSHPISGREPCPAKLSVWFTRGLRYVIATVLFDMQTLVIAVLLWHHRQQNNNDQAKYRGNSQ